VEKNIPENCDILVSIDDLAIETVCKEAGTFVPYGYAHPIQSILNGLYKTSKPNMVLIWLYYFVQVLCFSIVAQESFFHRHDSCHFVESEVPFLDIRS
jgi:hypothetical protein